MNEAMARAREMLAMEQMAEALVRIEDKLDRVLGAKKAKAQAGQPDQPPQAPTDPAADAVAPDQAQAAQE